MKNVKVNVYGANVVCASCVNAPTSKDIFDWIQPNLERKYPDISFTYNYIDIFDKGNHTDYDESIVERIEDGWLDFDVVVASPDMMAQVGRLGRVLGPKGLMPNPKTGTVTMDVTKAVTDIKAGQVTYRLDKAGNVHVPIGKVSFDAEKLHENLRAIHDVIVKAKPASTKGTYIKNIALTSTFGPGVKVDNGSII